MACLPKTVPSRSQSDTSIDSIPSTRPSPKPSRSTPGQNCACEIEVSAHGVSM